MAVTYNENVILTFAEWLYRRAAIMVIAYALFGAVVGVLAGLGAATTIATRTPDVIKGIVGGLGAVGTLLGGMFGSERAFALRLMAQQALCQMHIERNTRGTTPAVASSGRPPLPPSLMSGGAQ
jgi:hypothetical protein